MILILPVQTGVRFFTIVLTVLILIHRPRLKDLKLNQLRGYLNQKQGSDMSDQTFINDKILAQLDAISKH